MPMIFNTTKCIAQDENSDSLRTMWFDCMAWLLLFVGVTEITEKNEAEVWMRISMHEQLLGPIAGTAGPITRDAVRAFIGCTNNVPTLTKAAFAKKMVTCWSDRCDREARSEAIKRCS
jgi:hypothetical protein